MIGLFVPETFYDILIIDDEPALLKLAKIYLEMDPGFRTQHGDIGAQGPEIACLPAF